jgi:hypothetical protein
MNIHNFVKAHWVSAEAWPRVRARLEDLRLHTPRSVNPFSSWSAVPDNDGWALITEQDWVPWPNLAQIMAHTHALRRIQIAQKLLALTAQWRRAGFIHGDLSPNNILVVHPEGDSPRLVAVDWVLDLQSREGTPRYVPEALAWQRKNHDHDEAAARIIASELGHRPF